MEKESSTGKTTVSKWQMVERYVVTPISVWSMEEKCSDVTRGVYWTLWVIKNLYYTKCTISNLKKLCPLKKGGANSIF